MCRLSVISLCDTLHLIWTWARTTFRLLSLLVDARHSHLAQEHKVVKRILIPIIPKTFPWSIGHKPPLPYQTSDLNIKYIAYFPFLCLSSFYNSNSSEESLSTDIPSYPNCPSKLCTEQLRRWGYRHLWIRYVWSLVIWVKRRQGIFPSPGRHVDAFPVNSRSLSLCSRGNEEDVKTLRLMEAKMDGRQIGISSSWMRRIRQKLTMRITRSTVPLLQH